MRALIQKHCRSILLWLRGLVVLAALAMPVLAKILAKTVGRARAGLAASGTVAVEFALVGPVLLLAIVGMFVFGVALNNWVILTNAAEAGALQFASSRGSSSPYTSTTGAITAAAPTLKTPSPTITLKVVGTACASDATCLTALAANAGNAASVTATYPCMPGNPNLTVYGYNYSTACTLTVTTTERIQ
jgi:Flp pilus assembly protein TadG